MMDISMSQYCMSRGLLIGYAPALCRTGMKSTFSSRNPMIALGITFVDLQKTDALCKNHQSEIAAMTLMKSLQQSLSVRLGLN